MKCFWAKIFMVLPLLIMLSQCAPMTTNFYLPEAVGGKVVEAHCPPVESFILFEKQGVIIGCQASSKTFDKISITVTFEVPEGKVVALKGNKIYSLENDKVFSNATLEGRIWVSMGKTAEFPVDSLMMGKTEWKILKQVTLYSTTKHAYYIFSATLTVPDPDYFVLRMPDIQVNEIHVVLPKVKFVRSSKTYLGPLNC